MNSNINDSKFEVRFEEALSSGVTQVCFYRGNSYRYGKNIDDKLLPLVEKDKILFLSHRSRNVLRGLGFTLNEYYKLDTKLGVFVEFIKGNFHITTYKGNRSKIKAGKFFRILSPYSSDTEISNIVSDLNESYNVDNWYNRIQTTDNLVDLYNQESLVRSCMVGKGEYYEYLESVGVKALYIENSNQQIVGRALLWEGCEYDYNKITLMDRRYFITEGISLALKKYAKDNGYYYRDNCGDIISPQGEEVEAEVRFEVGYDIEEHEVPYMDTLKYYSDGYLSNSYGGIELDSTCGDTFLGVTCECCGERVDPDYTYYIGSEDRSVCESCCNNYYVWCDDIEEYVHQDSAYITRDGEWYSSNDYLIWCDDIEEYVHQDSNNYYWVHDLDVFYYHTDDIEYCEDVQEHCSEYHETEEGVYVYDLDSCHYCGYDDTYWYHEDNYNSHLEDLKEENV